MPNPRNRIKSTGDTRPPEWNEDAGGDEDVLRFEPAVPDEEQGRSAMPQMDMESVSASTRGLMERVREEVRQRPVRALGGAFALGVLLAWF